MQSEQYQQGHLSVLVEEVLFYLNPQPGKTYLDVTFGAGGHTRKILEKEPNCTVIAVDWDSVALDTYGPPLQEEFGDRLILLWGNFSLLYRILKKAKINKVDGILADFGTSQMQIFDKAGFSFSKNTLLDMRMSAAHQKVTAQELVNTASESKLQEIFFEFGQERNARRITKAIIEKRKIEDISTTAQLANIVLSVVPRRKGMIHPATKVFQALRIAVNQELKNIQSFLAATIQVLKPGARVVCISFHSLEDRLVKTVFRQQAYDNHVKILTPKVVVASEQELQENPSSRSARLRVAERLPK